MPFEYGSGKLGIENPYSAEGKIRAVGGILVAGVGAVLLLNVPETVAAAGREPGVLQLCIALLLCGGGLVISSRAAIQVFRFLVGRNAPADLTAKKRANRKNVPLGTKAYAASDLADMLIGRKNLTFRAPTDWLSHMAHTVFSRVLYLPPVYRSLAEHLVRVAVLAVIGMAGYCLLWFLGIAGVIEPDGVLLSHRVRFLLVAAVAAVLAGLRPIRANAVGRGTSNSSRVSALIVPLLLPLVVPAFVLEPAALAALNSSLNWLIAAIFVLFGLTMALFGQLLRMRAAIGAEPPTEVSEYRAEWQESVHPQSLFTHFDSIVMKRRRHKEAPNRVYASVDSVLIEEGSENKGTFKGQIIQEAQPIYRPMQVGGEYDRLKAAATAFGMLLVLSAACLIGLLPGTLPDMDLTGATVELMLYAIVLWAFGSTIVSVVHSFWCEVQFDSLIVFLQCSGTYSESKISVGKAIYDTASSENFVVRSRLTPMVIVVNAVTSTFVGRGARAFDSPRYLLEFDRAPTELESILREFREFLDGLSHVAPIRSEEDAQTISTLVGLNRQASLGGALEPGGDPQDNLLNPPEVEGSDPVED